MPPKPRQKTADRGSSKKADKRKRQDTTTSTDFSTKVFAALPAALAAILPDEDMMAVALSSSTNRDVTRKTYKMDFRHAKLGAFDASFDIDITGDVMMAPGALAYVLVSKLLDNTAFYYHPVPTGTCKEQVMDPPFSPDLSTSEPETGPAASSRT